MKRSLFYIFFILSTYLAFSPLVKAQEIKIKSFSMLMDPMIGPMQRVDENGEICALVKVIIPSASASFEGSLIGDCDFKTSEYWCYLVPGSKYLKIKYPNCEPLMVNFDDLIGTGLKEKMIYELVLSVPTSGNDFPELTIKGNINFEDLPWYFMAKEDEIKNITRNLKIFQNYNNGKYEKVKDISTSYIDEPKIKYSIEGIHLGDSITVITGHKDYAPVSLTIDSKRVSSGNYDLSLRRKDIKKKIQIIDASTNKPLSDIRIHNTPYYLENNEPMGISDENGYFIIKGKAGESINIWFDKRDLSNYYEKEDQNINLNSPFDEQLYIQRRKIINNIILPEGTSPDDLILTGANDSVPVKIELPYNTARWYSISYPEGFDSDYIEIYCKGYKTVRIFGEVFKKNPLKLQKGNETQIIEYRMNNGKIVSKNIK